MSIPKTSGASRASGGIASGERTVIPGREGTRDAFSPPQPITTRMHGALDYATAALFLTMPRALGWRPRTQNVLAAAGASTVVYSLFTDYEWGVVKEIPMTLHLGMDATSGVGLLLASATLLRGEPAAERMAVAALGAFELLVVAATRKPTGPPRLVPLPRRPRDART